MHAFLAEHRHRLFPDEMFADLFPTKRGRPSVPADVVATVMVLQALEGRSDREATRALQCDIAWKAAAGLSLTDEAFHPTVFTLWRNKLRSSEAPQRIFDAVRAVIVESGVIAGKHRRRQACRPPDATDRGSARCMGPPAGVDVGGVMLAAGGGVGQVVRVGFCRLR